MKWLPLEAVASSIMFNQKFLESMALAREENKKGSGDPIIADEKDAMNGRADI